MWNDTANEIDRQKSVELAGSRLYEASQRRIPCAPVRDLIGSTGIHAAYEVQRTLASYRTDAGARVVGHKIGLTSLAVQTQLGVDQPDFGLLFDDMQFAERIPTESLIQPRNRGRTRVCPW